ncbi:MAG: hypothetical protein AB1776_06665 [Bacillota bacterium]
MRTEIHLGKIIIISVQNNAGVFHGENLMRGWCTRAKSNSGFGRVSGDGNLVTSRLNLLNDPDLIDLPAAAGRAGKPPQRGT